MKNPRLTHSDKTSESYSQKQPQMYQEINREKISRTSEKFNGSGRAQMLVSRINLESYVESGNIAQYQHYKASAGVLTSEEEIELYHRRCRGDKSAVEEFIKRNISLAFSRAKKYSLRFNCQHLFSDLADAAIIGLWKAAKAYNPFAPPKPQNAHKSKKNGVIKFSTYASRVMTTEMRRELIRIEPNIERQIRAQKVFERIEKYIEEKESKNLPLPSAKEIAKEVHTKPSTVDYYLMRRNSENIPAIARREIFLPLSGGEIYKTAVSEEENDAGIIENLVNAINRLPEKDQLLIKSRYGIDGAEEKTLEKLGKERGITKEAVRQRQLCIEKKLRKALASCLLD